MAMIEIVGAVVDGSRISTNAQEIEVLRICGRKVEYIGRLEVGAPGTRFQKYQYLQHAPTLFVLDNGVLFRKCDPPSHTAAGESILMSRANKHNESEERDHVHTQPSSKETIPRQPASNTVLRTT